MHISTALTHSQLVPEPVPSSPAPVGSADESTEGSILLVPCGLVGVVLPPLCGPAKDDAPLPSLDLRCSGCGVAGPRHCQLRVSREWDTADCPWMHFPGLQNPAISGPMNQRCSRQAELYPCLCWRLGELPRRGKAEGTQPPMSTHRTPSESWPFHPVSEVRC